MEAWQTFTESKLIWKRVIISRNVAGIESWDEIFKFIWNFMKKFWHTKTLFIQAGRYKWSYRHNTCTSCKTVRFPHKWNWLCLWCFDKERAKKRKWALKRQQAKHYYKTKLLFILTTPTDYRKKSWPKKTDFNMVEYRKKWYAENREIMLLKWEVERRRKRWLPCLEIRINWKSRYFPFEWIEKPSNANVTTYAYNEYKERAKKYDLLYNWYNK